MSPRRLRLAFYGDDFTGSTDALEVLTFAGIRSALFLEPPSCEVLERFKHLEALGVAGDSRAMTPTEMDQNLPAVFQRLGELSAPIVHYKVCSTFDSGTDIGNIGRVMEIGAQHFKAPWLPVVAATPRLERWCLFGNLFARSGADGRIYRVDRHPAMSTHPITPMNESDLVEHLGRQGTIAIGSLPLERLNAGVEAVEEHLAGLRAQGVQAVVLDGINDKDMTQVGELLQRHATQHGPFFVVGSSGVESALTQHWITANTNQCALPDYTRFGGVDRVLAVSGSASALSAQQIDAALLSGFADLPVDAAALVGKDATSTMQRIVADATRILLSGRSVMLHTARGANDSRVGAMLDSLLARGLSRERAKHEGSRLLGMRLGAIVRDVLSAVPLRRLLLAGGDTCSQVVKVLAPEAIVVVVRLSPGAPLCRLLAPGRSIDQLEVALKGGQMGGEDYFVQAQHGTA